MPNQTSITVSERSVSTPTATTMGRTVTESPTAPVTSFQEKSRVRTFRNETLPAIASTIAGIPQNSPGYNQVRPAGTAVPRLLVGQARPGLGATQVSIAISTKIQLNVPVLSTLSALLC